jgi:hypothetical protein
MAMHLRSVEPARLSRSSPGRAASGDPLENLSLPGWLYFDPEFFEAEKRAFLRAAPQVVCHESDIAKAGEWRSIEYLGESVIVIRGDDAWCAPSPMSAGIADRGWSTARAAAPRC